jgi:hypothetical protein
MFLTTFRHSQMTAKNNIGLFFSTAAKATIQYTIKTVSQVLIKTDFDKIISNIAVVNENGINLYNQEFFWPFGYNDMYNGFYHQKFIKMMLEVQELFPNYDVSGKVIDVGCVVKYEVQAHIIPQDDINIAPNNMAGDLIYWPNIYF